MALEPITWGLPLGAVILAASFLPICRVCRTSRARYLKLAWRALAFMIAAFFASYVALFATLPRDLSPVIEYMIAGILFSGAIFVLSVALLMDWTVKEVARLAEREKEAILDPLTGLFNRRYFNERLKEECARACREGGSCGVLMIDLDRFKPINDTHGHQVGDLVLSNLATVLQEQTRQGEVLARIGGEEFALLSPGVYLDELDPLSHRIIQAARSTRTRAGRDSDIRVTVSVGAAALIPGETPEALLARADKALYQAKHGGRDRFVVSVPEEKRALSA